MQIYLVGGAVRDKLLNQPVKDKDWVVTGATPDHMLTQGFQQVGADFPVFLHPDTKEEYALARTERKTGKGYGGFTFDTSASVTLKDDLMRRDLTINAIAEDQHGVIHDPWNGQQDLAQRVLRHVSPAFAEDPLRVLRVARFAARYAHLGFTIAPETLELMSQIVNSGEIEFLTAERVWQETSRALMEKSPDVYFEVLYKTGALNAFAPELACLWGIPNPEKHHPEVDSGIHTLLVLKEAAKAGASLEERFACLTHDLGKGLTPKDNYPHHYGHEKLGLAPINALSDRIRVPNKCRALALLVAEYHTHVHQVKQLKPKTVLKVLSATDAFRQPERFKQLVNCCLYDAHGRTGLETSPYPQADYLLQAFEQASQVPVRDVIADGFQGKAIREQLDIRRTLAIGQFKSTYSWPED